MASIHPKIIPDNIQQIIEDIAKIDVGAGMHALSIFLKGRVYDDTADSLICLFVWDKTPQGHEYWSKINDRIMFK